MTARVVVVTGGTSGLGRAMAEALLAAGHRVVAVSRRPDAVNEFVASAGPERAFGVVGSVRSADDCERAVRATIERFGSVDALINNAGVHLDVDDRPKFYQLAEEQWRSIVDTHLTGAFLMTRAIVPHLLERRWGRIVNHETSYETMVRAGFTPYGAAKAGLEVATAGWASELLGTGVTVNAILPGGMANVARISAHVYPDRSKLVQPEVMGPPIAWLMSDAADGTTGVRLTARAWAADVSDAENLERASVPAGWTTPRAAVLPQQ